MKNDIIEKQHEIEKGTFSPNAYSSLFCVQLSINDFGKERQEHFKISNDILLNQLQKCEEEGVQFCERISNMELSIFIIKNRKKGKHNLQPYFVWEHASSTTTMGRQGIMKLVPREQHTPKSKFWKVIHSDYNSSGGYHEWAIPNGAPSNTCIKGIKQLTNLQLSNLSTLELPLYLHKAVEENHFEKFKVLVEHAKTLYTPQELRRIFTEVYAAGGKNPTTLLHRAVKNAYLPIINTILKYGTHTSKELLLPDKKGNHVVHLAAKHNRYEILARLKRLGADLNAINHKGETIRTIAIKRKFPYCLAISGAEQENFSEDNKEAHALLSTISGRKTPINSIGFTAKDPAFTYSGLSSLKSKAIFSNQEYVEKLPLILPKKINSIEILKPAKSYINTVNSSNAELNKSASLGSSKIIGPTFWAVKEKIGSTNTISASYTQTEYRSPQLISSQTVQRTQQAKATQRTQQAHAVQVKSQQTQQRTSQNTQQQSQKAAQQRTAQQRAQQLVQQRATQQRAQQLAQQRAAQQRAQQLAQQRAAQQRAQQLAQQRAAQQRAQQLAQQRAAQQRAQQLAQQRAAQQRAQQLAQQRAAQQRAQQLAQQRAAQQRAQQLVQQRAAQQRAQQLAQQRAAQQATIQRSTHRR